MKKSRVKEELKKKKKSVIDRLQSLIEMYRKYADLDEDDTIDPEDFSHQAEATEMAAVLRARLQKEKELLSFLDRYTLEPVDSVCPGALVKTDVSWYYIGPASPAVFVDGVRVNIVSPASDVFSKWKNAIIGSVVTLGMKKEKIEEIC